MLDSNFREVEDLEDLRGDGINRPRDRGQERTQQHQDPR